MVTIWWAALLVLAPALSAQSLLREVWYGVEGNSVADLTSHPDYPSSPAEFSYITLFEGPVNIGERYGTRIRGYLIPPQTGNYIFWIASDNASQLLLSTNEMPANKRLLATVQNYTGSREWTKEPNQQSAPVSLVAGQRYYVEVLHVEGTGGDNIAVGWQLPDGTLNRPITSEYLAPWVRSTNPPVILQQPQSQVVQEFSQVAFTVLAGGDEPLRYQWYQNGVALDGEITATLLFYRVVREDSGAQFYCLISNPFGAVTSAVATLTVTRDITPPAVLRVHPTTNAVVRRLEQVEVHFTEPVTGLRAQDLLVNGQPATQVTGLGSGPYVFQFPAPAAGPVTFSWGAHQITDYSEVSNRFGGGSWTVHYQPGAPAPQVRLNELVASNEKGLLDEDGQEVDWIELYNAGSNTVDLTGWALTDDPNLPGQWVFPSVSLAPGGYLVVFASGKDRRPAGGGTNRLHTNFQLAGAGEYLGLYDGNSPRQAVSELAPRFPEQRNDIAYGVDPNGQWRYFLQPTPGAPNTGLTATGMVSAPVFSARRGFYTASFNLQLSCPTPGAIIRYTTDGQPPTETVGLVYTGRIAITSTRMIRAAAFKPGHLPSKVVTHTYLLGQSAAVASLPVMSLVTAESNLTGPTGIIGINGGTYSNGVWQGVNPGDYFNPTNHGIAWERPVSAELIRYDGADGFQIDCGIRVHGSDHIRPRYTTTSKFSYRLYFRGDYGEGKLVYPLMGDSPVQTFDRLVIRAGKNDLTNPFIKDELIRRLAIDMGQVNVRGTFVNLFVNGVYKGYYNPTERVDDTFFKAWLGGEEWDVVGVRSEAIDGNNLDFNAMRSFISGTRMTNHANYVAAARWLDLTNFVDYLLVNIYGAMRDWPHNNWRAARERRTGALWRFYIWDAEGAFGTFGQPVDESTFTNALVSGTSEIPRLYQALVQNPEFRLLFADRIQKHFFNQGALTDSNVVAHFQRMRQELLGVIPSMQTTIIDTWVPQRRPAIFSHFPQYGLAAYTNAPVLRQHGGRVPPGYQLTMTTTAGQIYYTTNGADPRVPFTGEISPDARLYSGPLILNQSLPLRARARVGTQWSALTAADFQVGELGVPIRISEIMYQPVGGGAYEYVELLNTGGAAVNLGNFFFGGIDFKFLPDTWLAPGQRLVVASAQSPADFLTRYPGLAVAGWFNGNLRNEGERLDLFDFNGRLVDSVTYHYKNGWPAAAAGGGASLELVDWGGDPSSPASWRASLVPNGTPGAGPALPPPSPVLLSELMADNAGAVNNGGAFPDWLELYNRSAEPVLLAGWRLRDAGTNVFVFPTNTLLPAGQYLVVWMDRDFAAPGLHAGFGLSRRGGALFLENAAGQTVDAVEFGQQLPNYTLGRSGGESWGLCVPTPGAANQPAATAAATNLWINEWLANSLPGQPDWLELHNRHPSLPVAVQGLYVGTSNVLHRLRYPAFIGPSGFLVLEADENPGPQHVNFKLPAGGGAIFLYDAWGFELQKVTYTAQAQNVSRGSLPDGSTVQTTFTASQSPGFSNYLNVASGIVLNEIMARNLSFRTNAAGNYADWIELHNTNNTPVSLAGMSLCLDQPGKNRWYFPPGVTLEPRGFLLVWCDGRQPPSTNAGGALNTGYGLESEGGGVYLYTADGRVTDAVDFGFQPANWSLGRVSGVWRLCAQPTPGATNSAAAGLAVGSNLRLNEWYANSLPGEDDWVEIYNMASLPVELSGFYLTDDPSIPGQTRYQFPPLSFIAPTGFVQVILDNRPERGGNHAAFALAAVGETLRLYNTTFGIVDSVDTLQTLPGYGQARLPNGSVNVYFTSVLTPEGPNVVFFPLTIFQQPASVLATNGNAVTFSVWAQGTGTLRYQWHQNGQPLAGATNATLSLSNVGSNHLGQYFVRLTDDLATLDSEPATLTLLFRPNFVLPPSNRIALAGQSLTFRVGVEGTPPLTFRWQRGPSTMLATNVDDPVLILTNLNAEAASYYRVTVTNVASAGVASRLFFVVVVTNYPLSQVVAEGATVTLQSGATGMVAVARQWLFNGEPLPGQTNVSLTLSNFTAAHQGAYAVRLTIPEDELVTPPAWLTLPRPIVLEAAPAATPEGLRLTVQANPGLRYVVEGSADLRQWRELSSFTHTNGPVVLPWMPGSPQQFYRLRRGTP
ncbi:MAG: lamin tail domain-containing protein [Verrucomicrobiae bacterium]|nr:lamin tail domain-containing protein [Verrucomicrobiae bacterium]